MLHGKNIFLNFSSDFQFLWECLKVIFITFLEPHGNHGSLSSMRDKINRKQVDKGVKVINVGDEFLVHTFKAHLAARICTHLYLSSTTYPTRELLTGFAV